MADITITRSPRGRWIVPLAALAAVGGISASAAGPAAPARRTVVDPAVVPAGGVARCPQCSVDGCRPGHCRHGGPRHQPGCRGGVCVPYCPVRPGEFGFYGTQWRRWPGPGVVTASAELATPAVPPRSAVPGADEESPRRPDDEAATATPEPPAPRELPEPESAATDAAPEPPAEAVAEPVAEPAADSP